MEPQNINFQLRGIEIIDISIIHPDKQLPIECKFNIDVNIQQKIIGNEKTIIVTPKVTVKIEEDNFVCGIISVNFVYVVDNLNEFQKKDSEEFDLPDSFVITLNSISLSTIRGIMFSHFKGTFLHNTILPIVNPADFTKEVN
jgi:hypothetical protein